MRLIVPQKSFIPTLIMSRWRAFAIHLLISLLIGASVFALLFFVWYPRLFFEASGGDRLVLLLLAIDVSIGPLLTLIVFRSGKRGLAFDLSFIAFCQLAALLYGLSVITAARPVFVVFAVDRFVLVSANQLEDADLAAAPSPLYRKRSWFGPQWVSARPPKDMDLKENMNMASLALSGKDIELFPKYYQPYEQDAKAAGTKAKPLSELKGKDEHEKKLLRDFLARQTNAVGLGFLPVVGRTRDQTAILERKTGEILNVLDVAPW